MLTTILDTLVIQIGAIIIACIGTYGLIASTRESKKTNKKLTQLDKKNDEQHAAAEVARTLYNQQRDRDHIQIMDGHKQMSNRIAVLEEAVAGHIEWEETGKYRDLIVDHARLKAERKQIASLLAKAISDGGELPLEEVINVLAGEA